MLELKAIVFAAMVAMVLLMRMEAQQGLTVMDTAGLMKLERPEKLSALGLVSWQFSNKAATTIEDYGS